MPEFPPSHSTPNQTNHTNNILEYQNCVTSKRGIVLPDVKKHHIEHRGSEDSANILY